MRQPHPSVSPNRGPGLAPGRAARSASPGADRLRLRPDPLRLLASASPWRAAGFLLSYLIIAPALFCVVMAVSVATAMLAVTVALVPLLIAAAAIIRGCAEVARVLLGQVVSERVRGAYPPGGEGLWRRARVRWTSSATWRDLAYLAGLFAPLYALGYLVMLIWTGLLAGMTLPLWYRSVSDVCLGACSSRYTPGVMIGHFPHGPHGAGASGLYVYSTGHALIVAGICAAAFLLFNYVVVLTARLHGRVGAAVLRRPADPLAPARSVLSEAGPLGSLVRGGPWPESGPPAG